MGQNGSFDPQKLRTRLWALVKSLFELKSNKHNNKNGLNLNLKHIIANLELKVKSAWGAARAADAASLQSGSKGDFY